MMLIADYPLILFSSMAIPMIKKLFMASLLMCIANNTWARPNPNIPEFDARVADVYTVQHHDMRNGQRELRIYSAVPQHISGKRPVLFMLDGNGLYPLAVNQAAQQFSPINYQSLLVSAIPALRHFPRKNAHTTTHRKLLATHSNTVAVHNLCTSFSPSPFAHGLSSNSR